MDTLQKLIQLFVRFPGIGPRQATRFVYFLLSSPVTYRNELVDLIGKIQNDVTVCSSCQRFYSGNAELCKVCGNKERDSSLLLLVEKDVDLDNIERTKNYAGLYFVIGGTVPILEKNPNLAIREKELLTAVESRKDLKEIVLAFSVNPEGENTTLYITKLLASVVEKQGITISSLGRGLSTGSELEYSDSETIKNALENRH